MPTLTLTITNEQLARLRAGDTTLTLTATLRERKPKTSTPLPDHLKDAFDAVTGLWAAKQPMVSPALAWKAIKPLVEQDTEVLEAMAVALDFNEGRVYQPTWFAKDIAFWRDLTHRDLFQQEEARSTYRRGVGLNA